VVHASGRVAALLELGSGFNPEFTGRENVYLNGAILGFSREEMEQRFDEIAAFADIGDFMDQPVKLYSSGMFVRLAFAVQACLEPDVFIVDEALAVGDIFFQQKCHARMEDLQARNTALLFVSHDMGAVEKHCSKTLLLNEGQTLFYGNPGEAAARYYYLSYGTKAQDSLRSVTGSNSRDNGTSRSTESTLEDWPTSEYYLDLSKAIVVDETTEAICTAVAICNLDGQPCHTFEIGQIAVFYYEFEILQDILVPVGGVTIKTSKSIPIHAKNSLQCGTEAPAGVRKGDRVRFRQTIKLDLAEGSYTFSVALGTMNSSYYERAQCIDYAQVIEDYVMVAGLENAGSFNIIPKKDGLSYPFYGYVDLDGDCHLDLVKN
jgi:ABC-type multidrug transport system ATPase subunit